MLEREGRAKEGGVGGCRKGDNVPDVGGYVDHIYHGAGHAGSVRTSISIAGSG